ncbi:unnamed protein product [Adineta ricciae]|uniref:Transposase n=1 Tax=Adineta ricciae TaxID=249248 RepID=A0A816F5U0_ADIRI|nr:unnamed protein product [Adineta ricciae]CAF1656474.1 unnamed protein product [Adineta ricciae]
MQHIDASYEEGFQAASDLESLSNTHELAEELGVDQNTVWNYLKKLDFVHKKPRQDSRELTEAQAAKQIEICRQLLNNPLDDRFWKQIVTPDEKWVYRANHDRSKRWVPKGQTPLSVSEQNQFETKIMIGVWWNFEGILHFELVPNGRTTNAEFNCEQLDGVYDVLVEKYPSLVRRKRALFQQDNVKPYTARTASNKFEELDDVEILLHPPYSPDVAPPDYDLVQSM